MQAFIRELMLLAQTDERVAKLITKYGIAPKAEEPVVEEAPKKKSRFGFGKKED